AGEGYRRNQDKRRHLSPVQCGARCVADDRAKRGRGMAVRLLRSAQAPGHRKSQLHSPTLRASVPVVRSAATASPTTGQRSYGAACLVVTAGSRSACHAPPKQLPARQSGRLYRGKNERYLTPPFNSGVGHGLPVKPAQICRFIPPEARRPCVQVYASQCLREAWKAEPKRDALCQSWSPARRNGHDPSVWKTATCPDHHTPAA